MQEIHDYICNRVSVLVKSFAAGPAVLTETSLSPIVVRLGGLPFVALKALSSDYFLFRSAPHDERSQGVIRSTWGANADHGLSRAGEDGNLIA